MSLYETIEMTFLQLVKSGQVPARLHLTEEGLTALINDRTLGASWTPSIPDFWDQRVLGLSLAKATIHNALQVEDRLIFIVWPPEKQ
ncbi:hypothetical protein [Comamonas sp.]|uniref:hypothetical protein n=1 Tax=Comamonas sp. TaxID=34028 RepID=UPI0028A2B46B|nr:hypothetical protein [Comamonas sp.]